MPHVFMYAIFPHHNLPTARNHCTLTGAARSTITPRSKVSGSTLMDTDLDGSFTVLDLKALVSDMTEMPMDEMRVLHKGRALHNDDTLDACGASAALAILLISPLPTNKTTTVAWRDLPDCGRRA